MARGMDDMRALCADGLRNAHAVENQAMEIIDRQISLHDDYPEFREMLRLHLDETRQQKTRIEGLLARLNESPSSLKDMAMSFMGNVAAMMNAPADDAILKNLFSDTAFEAFEVASYRSLIAMAEQIGETDAVGVLQQSLREEEAMQRWLIEHNEEITRRFMGDHARAA